MLTGWSPGTIRKAKSVRNWTVAVEIESESAMFTPRSPTGNIATELEEGSALFEDLTLEGLGTTRRQHSRTEAQIHSPTGSK